MKLFLPLIFAFQFSFGQAWLDKLLSNNTLPPDKLKHSLVTEAITAGTGYTLYSLSNNLRFGWFFGTLTGIAANGGKELSDRYFKTGTYDPWDFVAGSFGAVKSGLTLIVVIDMEKKNGLKNNYLYYNQ